MSEDRQNRELSGRQEEQGFIRETVLPSGEKRRNGRLLLALPLLLLFGVISGLTGFWAGRYLDKKNENVSGSISFGDDDASSVAAAPQSSGAEEPPAESTGVTEPGAQESLEQLVQEIVDSQTPGTEDLRALYRVADGVVNGVNHSLVKVVTTSTRTDWFNETYSRDMECFGVIVAVTEQEVLVLTSAACVETLTETGTLAVTFGNATAAAAYTRATDSVTGLAVLAVSLDNVVDMTRSYIKPITLGNSYACSAGQPVIAMGQPAGTYRSIGYGILTCLESDVELPDNSCQLLCTDMNGTADAAGFLVNLEGSLVGWISPEYSEDGLIRAIGISALKGYIENLSNGRHIGYLGVEGFGLSSLQAKQLGLTQAGFYIRSSLAGSPAREAGLQSGDVLVEMAGSPIQSVQNLRDLLRSLSTEQRVPVTVLRRSGESYQSLSFDVAVTRR